MTAAWLKTSRPEHSGPATVTGTSRFARRPRTRHAAPAPDPPSARIRCSCPTSAGPEDMVDAAVEDDHGRAVDGLAVDDAGQVRAGRPDQEPAGFEEQPSLAEQRVARPGRRPRPPGPRPAGRGRAIPRAARTGCRARRPRRSGAPSFRSPARAGGRLARSRRRARPARPASSTFEAPKACSPSSSRWGEAAARRAAATRSPDIHPELAGPVVADEPDALERASSVTAARSRTGCRRPASRRDGLEPAELARRLDRDRADPGRDGGPQLFVALAGAGHHDALGPIPARATVASSPPDATSAPSPSRPRWATTASAGFALTA